MRPTRGLNSVRSWDERHSRIRPFLLMVDDLRSRVPDSVPEDVELFLEVEDGEEIVYGRDEHGEFELAPMRGAPEPPEKENRCGAVLTYTMDRYGQVRYCTCLTVGTFAKTTEVNYEYEDFCKLHQSRHALMEHAHELFEHGYFATNYTNFVGKLSAEKFLFAVEMVGGLFEMSRHDFAIEEEERAIDTSDCDMIEEDSVTVSLPIPSDNTLSMQANELWTASLKEVMTQNMQEAVFESGMEKKTLTESADMEGQITDTHYEGTEHHLHLPLSRLAKDIKEHLKNGGVALDDDEGGVVTFQKNDYTLDVTPDETEPDAAEDPSEVSTDFAEHLEAEEIEVDG